MSSIPEEMYQEVLLRLPVQSLRVCKSVCRNWYALITSSHFVKLHLNLNYPNLMLDCAGSKQLYSICYDSLETSVCAIENAAVEIDQPFKSLDYDVRLLGSCHGLVWMLFFDNGGDWDFSCLWNPATREYKEIPKSRKELEFEGISAFGYDYKTGNYKLAIGGECSANKGNTLLQVYSLASNSWESEIAIPYLFLNKQASGVLVNGDLHWLAMAQIDFLLVSLDFSDESFKEMQLPKELLMKNKDPFMVLGVLEGCLCVIHNSYVNGDRVHFEIWEMLNYGVQESWTRRYIIAHESIFKDYRSLTPLWSFKDGKILFLTSGSLVLYDTEQGSARELSMDNNYFEGGLNYFESLVSLKTGTYVGRERRIEEFIELEEEEEEV